MDILEGEAVAGLVPGVLGDNIVDKHGNTVANGAPAVQNRSPEVQSDFQAKAIGWKLPCLEEASAILDSRSTIKNSIFHHSHLFDSFRLVELDDLAHQP